MATIASTLRWGGICRTVRTYSSAVCSGLWSRFRIWSQQWPKPNAVAARPIKVAAIAASSTQTSHFTGSAQTTIARGASFKNALWLRAWASAARSSGSVTAINSQGLSSATKEHGVPLLRSSPPFPVPPDPLYICGCFFSPQSVAKNPLVFTSNLVFPVLFTPDKRYNGAKDNYNYQYLR